MIRNRPSQAERRGSRGGFFLGWGLVSIATLSMVRYLNIETYLALGSRGPILFVAALLLLFLPGAIVLRPSKGMAIGGGLGLAIPLALLLVFSPMPYELARVAGNLPVAPGADEGYNEGRWNWPLSRNSATQTYHYPRGSDPEHVFGETVRRIQADGWKVTGAHGPPPYDPLNPTAGYITAERFAIRLYGEFYYMDDHPQPRISLSLALVDHHVDLP